MRVVVGLLILGAGGFSPAPVAAQPQTCTGDLRADIELINDGNCTVQSPSCPIGCGFVNNCLHPRVTVLPVQVVADP